MDLLQKYAIYSVLAGVEALAGRHHPTHSNYKALTASRLKPPLQRTLVATTLSLPIQGSTWLLQEI